MKTPVEHVRISTRGKDILQKVKRNTGMEYWNEICRLALCRSLNNPISPSRIGKHTDCALEIEWKTFVGKYHEELLSCFIIRAKKDGIDLTQKEDVAGYFRAHIERGIDGMKGLKLTNCLTISTQHDMSNLQGITK